MLCLIYLIFKGIKTNVFCLAVSFAHIYCTKVHSNFSKNFTYQPWCHGTRDSGNDFVRFSVPFLEGRISNIRTGCNYPTRNANFKSWISDFWFKSVLFLVSHYKCRISTQKDTTEEIRTQIKRKRPVCDAMSGKRKLFPLSLHGTLRKVVFLTTDAMISPNDYIIACGRL